MRDPLFEKPHSSVRSVGSILFLVLAPGPLVLGATGVGPSALAQEAAAGDEAPGILLPESRAARAWAAADASTSPATIPTDLLGLGEEPWRQPACWRMWGELVSAERAAPRADAQRRAMLCLLARRQGRNLDAWAHFSALTASPEWAAAVLPHLIPGIPAGAAVETGGLPAALPNGVILRPIPPPAADPTRLFQPRTAEVRGLRIGAGEIRMTVKFESSGIEIEIQHTGGEPVEVSIVLPEPEGLEMNIEYTNWAREEDVGMPRALTIGPGEEPLSLYGRFGLREATVPTGRLERMPDTLSRDGLFIEGPVGSAQDPVLDAAATTLADLLDLPVSVRDADNSVALDGPSGVVVRLGDDATQRLSYLVTRVEEFLLGSDPR